MARRPQTRPARSATPGDTLLRRFTGYCMKRAYLVIEAEVMAALAPHDLRLTAFSALGIIIETPGLTQTALANALSIERSSVVVIVDTLENRELISRNSVEGDRRTYALVATLRGRRLFEQIAKDIETREARLQAGLSPAQRAALCDYLGSVERGGEPDGSAG